ncbi:uncharacterized protein LOC128199842 isoform X2 [Bicyclus anynana]|nr:uncharacterized protein LOC128199810 [Bicyclus anynana]XP_052746975.1 uncharacterized protein LOC128199842 isoform X2 [Bicyclus anynana]
MDGVNMRALNALGSTVDRPFFIYNENEIVTIMDPPHLLKCFRNNFLKHNIKCTDNFATNAVSGIAKWEHVKEFFKNDNNNPNFVFAPALTDQHIHPNGKQKMKVKLAAQVLSHSVAAGIFAKVARNEISPEAVVTATLISKMDNIFDSLNADTPDLKRGKRYFTNITKKSEHLQLFHDMKTLFQNIYFIGVRCAPPSVNGWIRTIRAVERLWHNLQKFNINALATRRLNQDPLENLFGCIRGHCGSNPNPNVPQFIAGLKTSIVNNLKYKSSLKNCEADANSLLTNMTTFLKTNTYTLSTNSNTLSTSNNIPDDNTIVPDAESDEMQACAYVCGFIFKKLKNNTCEFCKNIMITKNVGPILHFTFTTFKEYNDNKESLNYMNIAFVECVETSATIINEYLVNHSHTSKLKRVSK